ncbi:hypothetical protein H8N01_25660 [Streptomyces sp. AC536]|uniref:hypothetical protein n=1 Tax=Streptomyces buecherae TaxID=2763006 RepID=UPI00164E1F62|nr:hypothetical protein [Streptomyces buecherae]MBC3985868.1 hypothetical protein [Streptomyces buecherae]QNJ40882.1 hypothetical protein H7H31_14370 [Streptomyces buecherae]
MAMLVKANETEAQGEHSMADELMEIYDSYMTRESNRTEEYKRKAADIAARNDAALRQSMGLPNDGKLPPGAYMRATVLGFRIVESSDDQVSAWLLSRVTASAGELEEERVSYTSNVAAAHWENGDWKIGPDDMERAAEVTEKRSRPAIVAPGDRQFNEAGWTAIRQAS